MLADLASTRTVADLVNDTQGLAVATMVAVAEAPASSVAGMAPTAPTAGCQSSRQTAPSVAAVSPRFATVIV